MKLPLLFCFLTLAVACSTQRDEVLDFSTTRVGDFDLHNCSLPTSDVQNGGPGRDGIPSIDQPQFSSVADVAFLQPDDLVLVLRRDGETKLYPHPILDWHEMVNDRVGDLKFALSYCPLTGTGMGWNRVLDGKETTFGVSGLLYNNNLLPYDRDTESLWSQLRTDCINGDRVGETAAVISLVEMPWRTARELFPDAQVLNRETGFNRDYSQYPYGNYKSDEALFFPMEPRDTRLPSKQRVLAVVGSSERVAFRFPGGVDLVEHSVDGAPVYVYRDNARNLQVAFRSATPLSRTNDPQFPVQDAQGIRYDVLGRSDTGAQQLELPEQVMGYWFAIGGFHTDVALVE